MIGERWKDIKGYEGLYQVSSFGRVRSLDMTVMQKHHWSGKIIPHNYKGKILTGSKSGDYVLVDLHKNKQTERCLVHRLVAGAFLIREPEENYINHKDGNTKNNNVSNLEWCTQSYNIQYAYDNKTKIPPHMKKVRQIDKDGKIIAEYISLQEAYRKTNIQASNIRKCCIGKRNHAGGYKWQYIE